MSATKFMGLAIFITGLVLVYMAFYTSDTLALLQSSVLHFLEHMQMLWALMPLLSRIALGAGGLGILIGLVLMIKSSRRRRAHEFD